MKELWGALPRPNLKLGRKSWTSREQQECFDQLRKSSPPNAVWTDPSRLLAYSYDATGERHWPQAVVFIEHEDQLAEVLSVCQRFGLAIIGRGAGTSLSGGTTPVVGGVVLAFAKWNQVVHIDLENREAMARPGLVNADFQAALAPDDLFYAPDPSSHRISTLGGNASENSGGPHCVKYGVTTNHVLGGEVYLADGVRRTLPTVRDWRPGLDLTGLVVGSEGTLALFTQVKLQVMPKPPAVKTLLAAFDGVERAASAVSAIIAERILPSTLELLDKKSIETIERFVHAGYPAEAGAVLLIEIDGSADDVDQERASVDQILWQSHALSVLHAQTREEVDNLWKGRRSAYGAAAQVAGHLWIQDVTVPRPLLAEMMRQVTAIGVAHGFSIMTIAHAGDGNLHPNLPYNPSDAAEVARMREADQAILRACVARGGSITGEHGIGVDKLEQLALMYSDDELRLMAQLKQVFDPKGLLNPGKAVLPIDHVADRTTYPAPTRTMNERVRALASTIASSSTVTVCGSGSQQGRGPRHAETHRLSLAGLDQLIELDAPNLTVTVQAGMTAQGLSAQLREHHLSLPTLPDSGTRSLGGLVATNARYWGDGGLGWRDHLLAAQWIDGAGRCFRFGRKTMKNVAGYDVLKLLIGSWGTLAAITELTFRLRPRPPEMAVAGIQSPKAVPLAALALELRNAKVPPRGLFLQHMGEDSVLWVWLEGRHLQTQRDVLSHRTRTSDLELQWYGAEQLAIIDHQHDLAWLDRAHSFGAVQCLEGGVDPAALPHLVGDFDHSECTFFAYPSSGAIELVMPTGSTPLPGWVARRHPIGQSSQTRIEGPWRDIESRIGQVFDPHHRFPTWEVMENA